jgi:hypothetical protein
VLKKIAIIVSALALMFIAVGCAHSTSAPAPLGTQPSASSTTPTPSSTPEVVQTPAPKPSGPIKATIIEPQIDGDTVSIPVSNVENDWNTQFAVNTQAGKMDFMAYLLNNKIYVRADVCPPCHSIGYSLNGNVLVCDRCATTFKADTGDGIQGACVDYPKSLVQYQVANGNIIMKEADLIVAYQNTMKPGWP